MIEDRTAAVGVRLVSMPEVARRLGVSLSKVYAFSRSGRLRTVKLDGSRRCSLAAIAEFVAAAEARAEAELRGEVQEP